MSQSAKPASPQESPAPRRGRAGALGVDAIGLADVALRRAGFLDPTLVLRWAAIAGDEVARVAQPIKYQEGPNGAALTLKCEAAASVFLQHETRTLTEKLNAYLGPGRIARIRLVPGAIAGQKQLPDHPLRARPLAGGEPPEQLADAIGQLAALRRRLKK